MAQRRTDVFSISAPLHPMTWGAQLDAEAMFRAYYVELAGSGNRVTVAESAAARERASHFAILNIRLGSQVFNAIADSALGQETIVFLSLKDAAEGKPISPQVARDLINKYGPDRLPEFVDWYLQRGQHSPKSVAAVAEQPPPGAKSSPDTSNAAPAQPTPNSAG